MRISGTAWNLWLVGVAALALAGCAAAPGDSPSSTQSQSAITSGIAFVQVASTTEFGDVTSVSAAYVNAQAAGDLNVVAIGWNDTGSETVSSVTDTSGNVYFKAIGVTQGTGLSQSIYYAKNIVKAAANTVKVTFSGSALDVDLRILEYSGLDTSNPLDVTAGASGTSATPSSGSATCTSANELVFGAGMTFKVFTAAGSGFTSRAITYFGDIVEDETVTTEGAQAATGTLNESTYWVMQMATFKAGSGSSGRTYTTDFPLTEDPISQGGNWINGGTTGLDWTNVRTTPGLAFGTELAHNYIYDDSIALLTGEWGPDQTVTATVHSQDPDTNCYQEVELLLRGTLTAHSAKLYEVNARAVDDSNSYMTIVRWNGPQGDYTYLDGPPQGMNFGIKEGDTFMANITGDVITVYLNGVQKLQTTDSTYATGSPGMGFYLSAGTGCANSNANYGFENYTATSN
jgi:hypothetical protein